MKTVLFFKILANCGFFVPSFAIQLHKILIHTLIKIASVNSLDEFHWTINCKGRDRLSFRNVHTLDKGSCLNLSRYVLYRSKHVDIVTLYTIHDSVLFILKTDFQPDMNVGNSVKMCSFGEFYNIVNEKCQKCTVCPKGDPMMFKCSSFIDTVCQSELWKDIPIPPNPVPTTSHVTRGPEAVEVLSEDPMSSPTILIVISAVFLTTILVTLAVAVFCLWRRVWRYKQEKRIQYLPRPYTGYQEADGEPRYHPLPSRERLKSNYAGTSIYANDQILNMPNTHIYVNLMDTIEGDYCTIDDDYLDLN